MKEINWDEAPEGFPIWIESLVSDEKSDWHYETDVGYVDRLGRTWDKPEGGCQYSVYRKPETKEKQNSVEWSGDGLPPVGTECLYRLDCDVCGVIVAHVWRDGEVEAIIQCQDDWWSGEAAEFYPIKTKEQQERSAYCDRIYGILCKAERPGNKSDMAEALYDAGLRFTEETDK